jgi:acyl transferase domain-containing protein
MNPRKRQILQLLSEKRISLQESLDLLRQLVEEDQTPRGPGVPLQAEPVPPQARAIAASASRDDAFEYCSAYLLKTFAKKLNVDPGRIQTNSTFEPYGVDSVAVIELIDALEKDFGPLPKTLLFEHNSIEKLSNYFLLQHRNRLEELFKINEQVVTDNLETLFGPNETEPQSGTKNLHSVGHSSSADRSPLALYPLQKRESNFRSPSHRRDSLNGSPESVPPTSAIAIVGVGGRYPMARDLNEFWRILKSGKSCIREIPADRWDHRQYYGPGKEGKSYSQWGGFIEDVDKFDPLFFGISPNEAQQMDPQERLFLEVAWETLEDAGYTREGLIHACRKRCGRDVGVFVGVMYAPYQLLAARVWTRANEPGPSSAYWSTANRVSYLFNFQGPSLAVDTACSSSLTAIHLACESIKRGECSAAIAGGVTLIIHPSQFVPLTNMHMLSRDDKCRAFGEGADGFVDGEGVGAVLLRPLADALQDGDQIYAVIKSTSINAGGKTSGYTVPNPNAQAEVIASGLERANIDPRTLSYVEAHGTATMLGDPIEIAGLTNAFRRHTDHRQYCAIGSVKSNIGHLQAAAGIAGLTKVLLQMKHKQIVPSLNAERLNPLIDFENSPFFVAQTLFDWERPLIHGNGSESVFPRRAGISSFGIGGANAHLVVEEFEAERTPADSTLPRGDVKEIILLSARNEERLRAYAQKLREWITADDPGERHTLGDMAYTSQVGREAMQARLALIVRTQEELVEKLDSFLNHKAQADILFSGEIEPDNRVVSLLKEALVGSGLVQELFAKKQLSKLAALWVAGFNLDWKGLHGTETHRRVSLPTYAFARKRYWISMQEPAVLGATDESSWMPQTESVGVERPMSANESRQFVTVPESNIVELSNVPQARAPSQGVTRMSATQEHRIRVKEIQGWITNSLVEVLKVDPSDLEMDRPFNDYGIDSLVGVTLTQTMGKWLGQEIRATLLWEYPTIGSLSEHLAEREVVPSAAGHDVFPDQLGQDKNAAVLVDQRHLLASTEANPIQGDRLNGQREKAQSLRASELLEKLDQLTEAEVDAYLTDLLRREERGEQADQADPVAGERPPKKESGESGEEQLLTKLKQFSEKETLEYFNHILSETN